MNNSNSIKHVYFFSSKMRAQTLDLDIVLVAEPVTDYLNTEIDQHKAALSSASVVVRLV